MAVPAQGLCKHGCEPVLLPGAAQQCEGDAGVTGSILLIALPKQSLATGSRGSGGIAAQVLCNDGSGQAPLTEQLRGDVLDAGVAMGQAQALRCLALGFKAMPPGTSRVRRAWGGGGGGVAQQSTLRPSTGAALLCGTTEHSQRPWARPRRCAARQ